MYEDHTADTGDLAVPGDAARGGRAAAMSRRRALAAGRTAPAPERVGTGFRETEFGAPAAAVDPTTLATDGVAAARLGRVLSMRRRRQLSQGKQALNTGADRAAAAGAGRPTFVVLRGGGR